MPQQLRQIREVFDLVDADRSGSIDEQELQAAMSALGFGPDTGEAREVIAGADSNGDGKVEFDEFLDLMARKPHSEEAQDDLVQVFQLISGTVGWAPLLFDEDVGLSFQLLRRTARELGRRFAGEELHKLLVQGSPTGGVLSEEAFGEPSLAMRALTGFGAREGGVPPRAPAPAAVAPLPGQRSSAGAWAAEELPALASGGSSGSGGSSSSRSRSSSSGGGGWLRQLFPRSLATVSILLLRWRPTARAISLLMRWRFVAWALTPIFTPSFLMAMFRDRHASRAISGLLRMADAPRGIAHLLRHHEVLARVCEEPDAARCVEPFVGQLGLGAFVREFLIVADHQQLACFLRHTSTARLIAAMVTRSSPVDAAALVHVRRAALAHAIASTCQEPEMDLWGMRFVRCEGIDRWVGLLLNDPRGAAFARRVLLSQGFVDWVENFLKTDEAKAFVIRLLQQPGVCRFVTWLSRDAAMCRWFAGIASRDSAMVFVTEMLLEPGLDRFMVSLLLRPGNDAALRTMLEHWVRAERSLGQVVNAFAQTPSASRSLARVIVSPGFLDRFVVRRLLLQPGLAEVVVEAVLLVGFRGLQETVLPLALSTVATVIAFSAAGARSGIDLQIAPLLEELQGTEGLVGLAALLLGLCP